jgi:16S rRNA (adenine1518-N6/adenine1519-N6)-dimethyltransferase
MTRLGQHFLKNPMVAQKIIDALGIVDGDVIIEIGSGHGELTAEILGRNKKIKLIAIEKDPNLISSLEERFKDDNRFFLIEGDALEILPILIGDFTVARKDFFKKTTDFKIDHYKLAGNIPYYITGHLLRIVGELTTRPTRVVFMVQKEVAERIVARPPHMNRLAAAVQFWADAAMIASVPRKDFNPAPKIDSAVFSLALKKRSSSAEKTYYEVLRTIFAQPRKTVLNNIMHDSKLNIFFGGKDGVLDRFKKININPNDRPQNLSVSDVEAIALLLS